MADLKLVRYRGDTFRLPVIVKDSNGEPIDLSDAVIRFTLGEGDDAIVLVSPKSWNEETAYEVDDLVFHEGSIYQCIEAHTNEEPPNEYWELVETEGIEIERDDENGEFTITVGYKLMEEFAGPMEDTGVYYFDVEITQKGIRQTYFVGELTLREDMTK